MNKYLKILMLSGGLVGAIIPTAIDMDKNENNDLSAIYEQVEKMQNIVPKLSRINYKLNISLDDSTDNIENETNLDTDTISTETIEQNTDIVNDGQNVNNTSNNVSFTATDENGNESSLTNQETLNYLNETLVQTNIEYEQLKATLSEAIKDTMDYLESYKNGETTLTNEQKIYIKEHTNSIKFLAETLENLSEDVICCIDGCENCDESDFESSVSTYLTSINELEKRISTMHDTITSLQFINSIGSPYFYAGRYGNPYMFYGFHYNNLDNNENNKEQTENENSETETQSIEHDTAIEVENNENENIETENTENNSNSNTNTNLAVDTNNDKPTTFGLKSNIDTYAPTRRNIDTFYNTALQNNEFMYGNGYGYGMPYGYGGYGYGMPYGGGYYGNPYGNNLNSNIVNRAELEKLQNENNVPTTNNVANIDNESEETTKPNKIRVKRAKNIDTYTGTTVQSNINTMGESKISKFFKEKFNSLRNKVRNHSNNEKLKDNSNNLPNIDENTNTINNTTDEIIENDFDNSQTDNKNETTSFLDKLDARNSEKNTSVENYHSPIPKQEDDIKAR